MNILIVDDQQSARTMLREVVESISPGMQVRDFEDPLEALRWSQQHDIDLLLLDYRMPQMDGLEFARQFRLPLHKRDVPIVLVSVVGDEPVRNAALDAGVMDFLIKPVRPRELRLRCRNLLSLRRQGQTLKEHARALEQRLVDGLHEAEQRERETLTRLARAIESRDAGSGLHPIRIARFAALIAEGMNLPDEEVGMIELAAPLHDIGTIGIADAILLKPGPLTAEEFAVMRGHTQIGYDILRDSPSRFIQLGASIALNHHERWDGAGYPNRLRGDAIPLAARIVALADVFDALISKRPYRDAWAHDEAVAHVRAYSGTIFDPACVDALLRDTAAVVDIENTRMPDHGS